MEGAKRNPSEPHDMFKGSRGREVVLIGGFCIRCSETSIGYYVEVCIPKWEREKGNFIISPLTPTLSIAVPDATLPSTSMQSYRLRLMFMDARMQRWQDAMELPCSRPLKGDRG